MKNHENEAKEPWLDEENIELKDPYMVFQFIDHTNGFRSQPFEGDSDAIHEILANRTEEHPKPHDDDYILCIAMVSDKETRISTHPLATVKTFMEAMNPIPLEEKDNG